MLVINQVNLQWRLIGFDFTILIINVKKCLIFTRPNVEASSPASTFTQTIARKRSRLLFNERSLKRRWAQKLKRTFMKNDKQPQDVTILQMPLCIRAGSLLIKCQIHIHPVDWQVIKCLSCSFSCFSLSLDKNFTCRKFFYLHSWTLQICCISRACASSSLQLELNLHFTKQGKKM